MRYFEFNQIWYLKLLVQTTENFTKARNKTHPSRRRKANKREAAREPEGVFTRKLRDWDVKQDKSKKSD